MKLSVIVPVGRPETASRTVASILRQSDSAAVVQVVLVGAELDGLREQCHDSRIHYVQLQRRLNPSATRIAGIVQATGDWYLFVDDDIELDCFFLERLAAVIASEENAGALGARLPGREKSYFSRVTDLTNFWSQQCLQSGERDWLYSAVLVVPRKVYEEVGGFAPDLAIGEDVDLTRRIKQAGYKVLYRSDLVGHHNHHRTTFSSALSYSWHNGGLALFQFRTNPQLRVWSAKKIIHTLLLSLHGTLRVNGRHGLLFYWHLPGIIFIYFVFALSLECNYQRCLSASFQQGCGIDPGKQTVTGNIFVEKYLFRRFRGQKFLALFFWFMAFFKENVLLISALSALVAVFVLGSCASV